MPQFARTTFVFVLLLAACPEPGDDTASASQPSSGITTVPVTGSAGTIDPTAPTGPGPTSTPPGSSSLDPSVTGDASSGATGGPETTSPGNTSTEPPPGGTGEGSSSGGTMDCSDLPP